MVLNSISPSAISGKIRSQCPFVKTLKILDTKILVLAFNFSVTQNVKMGRIEMSLRVSRWSFPHEIIFL